MGCYDKQDAYALYDMFNASHQDDAMLLQLLFMINTAIEKEQKRLGLDIADFVQITCSPLLTSL